MTRWEQAESAAREVITSWTDEVHATRHVPGATRFLMPIEGELIRSLATVFQVEHFDLSDLIERLNAEFQRQPFARVFWLLAMLSPALRQQLAGDAARVFAETALEHFQQHSPLNPV